MKTEPRRTCPSCGNELFGAMEFFLVCMLRKGLAGGVQSGESSSGVTLKPIADKPPQRFDHYELLTGQDGKPVELGRGAMGVTYKAFDINLHCPDPHGLGCLHWPQKNQSFRPGTPRPTRG